MSRKLKSHSAVLNSFRFPLSSKGEIVVEHFQDLLAFWPFVSFQEIKLPFPRIKLFLFFRRIVLLNTAIFAASTRGYRRGFKRFQLFNFFPQPCNIHGLWLSLGEFQILICWSEIFYFFIQGVHFLVCITLKVLKENFFAQSPLKCRRNGPYCCRKLTVERNCRNTKIFLWFHGDSAQLCFIASLSHPQEERYQKS